jgi:hypothetical protein
MHDTSVLFRRSFIRMNAQRGDGGEISIYFLQHVELQQLVVRDVVVWWGSVVGSSDREKQHEQDASMTTVCNIFYSTCGVIYEETRYEIPQTNAEFVALSYIPNAMDNSYPIIVHANWYHLNLLPYQRNM